MPESRVTAEGEEKSILIIHSFSLSCVGARSLTTPTDHAYFLAMQESNLINLIGMLDLMKHSTTRSLPLIISSPPPSLPISFPPSLHLSIIHLLSCINFNCGIPVDWNRNCVGFFSSVHDSILDFCRLLAVPVRPQHLLL